MTKLLIIEDLCANRVWFFVPYLVCPLYLLALLTFPTKFVGEPMVTKTEVLPDDMPASLTSQMVVRTYWQVKKCAEAILRTDRGEAIDLKR